MRQDDQAGTGAGDGWRMLLGDMRTVAALRGDAPDADVVARLSDRALRAAAVNPDHSEAGRAAAEAELHARRLSAEPWRIKVPGFIKPNDLARKGARLFFGIGRTVRVWSGWLFFGMFAGVIALAAWAETHGQSTLGSISITWMETEVQMSLATVLALLLLIALIVWFIGSVFRRKPARILLLRKFNQRHVSEPLEKMLAQELRPYGHVASLSDKHIKRDAFGWLGTAILSLSNPLAAIWFIIGMPIRFVVRLFDRSAMGPAVVLNARDYRNLAKRLRDRIGLNMQVATTSKEAFLVRTSDAWWKLVVRLFMDSSDAIVVDLSQVTAGTAWELDVIREEQTQARCVFVSIWGKADEAQAALRERGFDNPCFYYAPDGEMQRRPQFRAAMLAAMQAA